MLKTIAPYCPSFTFGSYHVNKVHHTNLDPYQKLSLSVRQFLLLDSIGYAELNNLFGQTL